MPGYSRIRRVAERVSREECEQRVLAALDDMRPMNAASVANHIWPHHRMTAQAAALAAGAILCRMRNRGPVTRYRSGWVKE